MSTEYDGWLVQEATWPEITSLLIDDIGHGLTITKFHDILSAMGSYTILL